MVCALSHLFVIGFAAGYEPAAAWIGELIVNGFFNYVYTYMIFMENNDAFDKGLFFAALADRTRLRLINLMGDDEVCVCYFVEVIDTNQPKISRHLAYLKKAGLVSVRREWKWAQYRLVEPVDPFAAQVFSDIRAWLKNDPEMERDRREMASLCCAPLPQQPISIQGAPRPRSIAVYLEMD